MLCLFLSLPPSAIRKKENGRSAGSRNKGDGALKLFRSALFIMKEK